MKKCAACLFSVHTIIKEKSNHITYKCIKRGIVFIPVSFLPGRKRGNVGTNLTSVFSTNV